MVRTLISLDPMNKKWLEDESLDERVALIKLVHRALASTRGLWKRGDALAYQRRVRSEWPER